ncbi:MAG: zinc ABC transporter permease [Chloroflexi bacterium AL-W]|nr:zinc ABC transporter permease [Chloroflexi bacterium AL-N1]NOK69548.1 zinc ABC transporter permease [Chloroflexi bacterium AL-N10]NOK77513.1 zinc ABC transporter permease [Chloroflexi bacterium AL-N5]NOK84364.1 zinc ABC transporter permease [Chloroflexi bacterium AL-W]NOK91470.1 zinc ABC transporter permease [Chloroflexi bacterium AL-N15]
MDVFQLLQLLFTDYTLRTVALGTAVLGIVSGVLGCYAVLRRQALLGDAMSHAALPGIVFAFLITGVREQLILLIGAALAGWFAAFIVISVVRMTRLKEDSALGIVLSVFFGFGMVLLSFAQKQPDAAQAGLSTFLFGQAASLVVRDVITMATIGAVALLLVGMFWKEFKLLSFDPEFGASQGFPIRLLDITMTSLIVVAIVIGLQTVGVILMSAMLVAPAAAARQWTDRLSLMVLLAAVFGATAGVAGALISTTARGLSTGPTIVLSISVIVLISMLFAPNRGLVWNWARHQRNRRRLRLDAVLQDLYALAQQHDHADHAHTTEVLRVMNERRGGVRRTLNELVARGLVQQMGHETWILTAAGLHQVRQLANAGLSSIDVADSGVDGQLDGTLKQAGVK